MAIKTPPFILLIFVIALFGCEPEKICTEVLISESVQVISADGEPVLLDEYLVIDLQRNDTVIHQVLNEAYWSDPVNTSSPAYYLLSDGEMERTSKEGSEFEFVGIKDEEEIARKTFLIGNDGCHIYMISEDNTIVL